jgi:asparagine synthase (glutamine-hydrolysing)
MSVQAGIWNLDGQPIDRTLLARISAATADLAPDGETTYLEGAVGMLYRPFHTTSESRLEVQPHVATNGHIMTWDGRLDNRDQLIADVRSEVRNDLTDAGIVSAAYIRWGLACFARLIGDWALAIWNPHERELILARDWAGIRHLYYYPTARRIIWSSQLAPLVACGDQFTLCPEYIASSLASRPSALLTPYREIQAIPPGSSVRIADHRMRVEFYWTFNPKGKTRYRNDREYEEQFRHLFRQAVRRRLRSPLPILAELSGGFDSSSIVCMADNIIASEGAEAPVLDTFSYSYPDEPEADDAFYFAKVEEKRGKRGHHAAIRGTGHSFPVMESGFVAVPGFTMRQEVANERARVIESNNYRVSLSGIGGDEFLGQATDPRVHVADLLVRVRLREFARHLTAWSLLIRRPWIQLLYETSLLLLPTWLRTLGDAGTELNWVNETFARSCKFPKLLMQAAEGPLSWLPSARDSFQTYVVLVGRLASATPTRDEIRYPFLDQNLAEFLMSIPPSQLLRPGDRRSLMKRALADLLPKELLLRRTKQSEIRCHIVTLQKHWEYLAPILADPLTSRFGYINPTAFRAALQEGRNGKVATYFLPLLRGLALELWLQGAVSRKIISPPSAEPITSSGYSKSTCQQPGPTRLSSPT